MRCSLVCCVVGWFAVIEYRWGRGGNRIEPVAFVSRVSPHNVMVLSLVVARLLKILVTRTRTWAQHGFRPAPKIHFHNRFTCFTTNDLPIKEIFVIATFKLKNIRLLIM